MIELVEGLWAVSGPDMTHPWDASAYLITGDEPTLIDCGSSQGYPALIAGLATFGYQPGNIKTILATHGHWDHLSAAHFLQAESGARLLIHDNDREQVETGDDELTAAFLYNLPFLPARVDGVLSNGDALPVNGHRIDVHHTPGHTVGSVCFTVHLRNGPTVLIAGDTLWGGFHLRIGSDLDAWKRSLDHLLELDYDALTFGHCPPKIWYNAKDRVREAKQQFGVYFSPWFKPFHLDFQY